MIKDKRVRARAQRYQSMIKGKVVKVADMTQDQLARELMNTMDVLQKLEDLALTQARLTDEWHRGR